MIIIILHCNEAGTKDFYQCQVHHTLASIYLSTGVINSKLRTNYSRAWFLNDWHKPLAVYTVNTVGTVIVHDCTPCPSSKKNSQIFNYYTYPCHVSKSFLTFNNKKMGKNDQVDQSIRLCQFHITSNKKVKGGGEMPLSGTFRDKKKVELNVS